MAALGLSALLETMLGRPLDALRRTIEAMYADGDLTRRVNLGTRPEKFSTGFDALADRILPSLQEPLLEQNKEVVYAIAIDRNGYVRPTTSASASPSPGIPTWIWSTTAPNASSTTRWGAAAAYNSNGYFSLAIR